MYFPSTASGLTILVAFSGLVVGRRFRINVLRYTEDDCPAAARMDADVVQIDTKDYCYTWADEKEFGSISYGWAFHQRPWDDPEDYGHCRLDYYEGVQCRGRSLGSSLECQKKENMAWIGDNKIGRCIGSFTNEEDGLGGKPKSVKLYCTNGNIT